MVYSKNTSRKQDFSILEEILKNHYNFLTTVSYRWDKNNWVTILEVRPMKTRENATGLDLVREKIPAKLAKAFKKAGFKVLKCHNWHYFHKGIWTTSEDAENKFNTLNLQVGKISEEYKWRLDRLGL